MLERLKYTIQGIFIGAVVTLTICGSAYINTHDIRFTSTASNQPAEIIKAEANAVSLAPMMQNAVTPAKPQKIVKVKTMGDLIREGAFDEATSKVPEHKPAFK